ncbi:hypothetical protein ACSQ67_005064 [Phaseolus vulgaris]
MDHFYLSLLLLFVTLVTLFFFILFHKRRLQQVPLLQREQAGDGVVAGQREQGVPLHPAEQLQGRVEEDEKVAPTVPETPGPPRLRSHHGRHSTDPLRFPLGQPHPSHRLSLSQEVLSPFFIHSITYTFLLACRLFMSVEDENHVAKFEKPFQLLAAGIISVPIDLPGTPFNKAIKAAKDIRKELLKIIRERKVDLEEGKATARQDILSHMLLTCDENGEFMNELDIADKILGLLIGGHDTASAACTFLVKYLAELPHIYDAVYQEQMEIANSKSAGELLNWDDINKMKYSWNVACEVMRIAPPLQGGFREAINDFVFNGFSIPKGWKLYWSANATHKNPEYFSEPRNLIQVDSKGKGRLLTALWHSVVDQECAPGKSVLDWKY